MNFRQFEQSVTEDHRRAGLLSLDKNGFTVEAGNAFCDRCRKWQELMSDIDKFVLAGDAAELIRQTHLRRRSGGAGGI